MSYIVVVNPQILKDGGLAPSAVVTATILAAALGSILMGLVARLPYALAPGMGLNALFTYDLVLERKLPPEDALGLVVWSGIIFLVLSATPFRRQVARAIPLHLREAVAAGIGVFLAFIGLQKAGIVVGSPATLVTLGPLDTRHMIFLVALLLAAALHRARKPYAFLLAILAATALGALAGHVSWPSEGAYRAPDTSLLFAANMAGAFEVALLPPLLSLLFTDLFDSLSTFVGVASAAGLVDEEGEPLNVDRALLVDAGATLASGVVGTSPATTYVESTAGIEAGGRTGLTAIVAGLAFLPLMAFSPLIEVIPPFATAPILLIVGALMTRAAAQMSTRPLEERLPAFAVLVLIPLTFSITHGILWGFVLHPLLFLLARRGAEVRPMMWLLFVVAVALLTLEQTG